MSTSYLSNDNFESLHSNQLQPKPARPSASTPSGSAIQLLITDIARLENADPAMNTRATAALLGMSYSTVKKMRQRKQGPDYYKTESGAVRYLLSAVLAYRATRTVKHRTTTAR